jgi:hypothetical protein
VAIHLSAEEFAKFYPNLSKGNKPQLTAPKAAKNTLAKMGGPQPAGATVHKWSEGMAPPKVSPRSGEGLPVQPGPGMTPQERLADRGRPTPQPWDTKISQVLKGRSQERWDAAQTQKIRKADTERYLDRGTMAMERDRGPQDNGIGGWTVRGATAESFAGSIERARQTGRYSAPPEEQTEGIDPNAGSWRHGEMGEYAATGQADPSINVSTVPSFGSA